jgi:uncharacterized protein involved in oxidation of intracellular sulfur
MQGVLLRFQPTRHPKPAGTTMTSMIISGSRGTDDPTMASLPFIAAKTAKEAGHDVVLWLWNEAVTIGRQGVADHVVGVNLTPLKDLLAAVQAADIPIWVCGACAVARQISVPDLVAGAAIKGMPDYIAAVAERDKNIAF